MESYNLRREMTVKLLSTIVVRRSWVVLYGLEYSTWGSTCKENLFMQAALYFTAMQIAAVATEILTRNCKSSSKVPYFLCHHHVPR